MSDNKFQTNMSELTPAQAELQQKLSLIKQKKTSGEVVAPVDSQAALLDQLRTVTEKPGALTRADQRNLANSAESAATTKSDEVAREREANEKFKAAVLAKRAKKESNMADLTNAISSETKPVMATVDQNGSTILDDEALPEIPKLEPITLETTENIPEVTTPPIMSEGTPPLAEIVPEVKNIASTPVATPVAPQPEVPFAEQFGVAEVPLVEVPKPAPTVIETPVPTPAVEVPIVMPTIPVTESIVPPITPAAPEFLPIADAMPVSPEVNTPVIAAESIAPLAEPVAEPAEVSPAAVQEASPVVAASPTAEIVPPVVEKAPVVVDTAANHKNISSLKEPEVLASAFANIGGGGVELPVEEEKK